MATLTLTPTYPLPGVVTATLALDEAATNYARLWITAAPPGSQYRKKLDDSAAGRVEIMTGHAAEKLRLTLDASGAYTFKIQEYTRTASTYGGGYEGDPNSYPSETKVGAEYTVTVQTGSRMVTPVGDGSATLVLYVFGATVNATTKAVHGELSPALISPTTDKARLALEAADVLSALAGLDGVAASAIVPTDALLAEMRTDFAAHMQNGSFHDTADNENSAPILTMPSTPANPQGRVDMVRTLHRALVNHMKNQKWSGEPEEANDEFHEVSSVVVPDYENLPITTPPGGPADGARLRSAIADLFRAYEAHRASAIVHTSADSTNTLTESLGALASVDQAFLEFIAATNPTPPATANSGAVVLTSLGFTQTT